MAEKNGVIRLDNVSATKDGSLLKSVRYMGNGSTPTKIENGSVVILSGLMSGEREVFKGVTPTADAKGTVAIICTPELIYDESTKKDLWDFINDEGQISRAFIPTKGDIFSVTKLDGTKKKGDKVCLQDGETLDSKASADENAAIGEIIDVETVGQLTYYVIQA